MKTRTAKRNREKKLSRKEIKSLIKIRKDRQDKIDAAKAKRRYQEWWRREEHNRRGNFKDVVSKLKIRFYPKETYNPYGTF